MTFNQLQTLLTQEGSLSQFFPNFEVRQSQAEMLADVSLAFQEKRIALIEAGTGTGKSLAYLLPALFWALEQNEKIVISTNTIALQEQLLNKDIPLLVKAFDFPLQVTLVKGMNNYLCRRKIEDAHIEKKFLSERERTELEKIEASLEGLVEGSRSELSFVPIAETWERVKAEGENCTHVRCPYYKQCFFFKARQDASFAHILVVNHHLLCSDIAARADSENYQDPCILPPFNRLIIDEAHHMEEVATEYFASRVSRSGLSRVFGRLAAERASNKLKVLYLKILETYPLERSQESQNWMDQLEIYLPSEKRELLDQMERLFQAIENYITLWEVEEKLRLREIHLQHPMWISEVQPCVKAFVTATLKWVQSILNLVAQIERDALLKAKCEGIGAEINGLCSRIQTHVEGINKFVFDPESPNSVRWIEGRGLALALVSAQLDISEFLSTSLFQQMASTVLCSATLSTNQDFKFVRKNLGISDPLEKIYPSPFDYASQSLLLVPEDMPDPDQPHYIDEASKRIQSAIKVSRGNAFVLFTSYHMLHACEERLRMFFQKLGYPMLCQGEENRQALLERFRKTPNAILLGTDSFWEGVDVAGEALRNVIIAKLPFKVPTDPLFQARSELITAAGGSPFFEYSLPLAIMKLKQGFGRLIRTGTDRGCVVCLDPRLIRKPYGKHFIKSLPPSRLVRNSTSKIIEEMERFYNFK